MTYGSAVYVEAYPVLEHFDAAGAEISVHGVSDDKFELTATVAALADMTAFEADTDEAEVNTAAAEVYTAAVEVYTAAAAAEVAAVAEMEAVAGLERAAEYIGVAVVGVVLEETAAEEAAAADAVHWTVALCVEALAKLSPDQLRGTLWVASEGNK